MGAVTSPAVLDTPVGAPLTARRGRHRSQALARYRRARAVELVLEGRTYQQVADELGYANRGTVHRLVQQALQQQVSDGVQDLRATEVARLDALQTALWARAMAGDVAGVIAVVRIVEARRRLLGLVGGRRTPPAPLCDRPSTVVVHPDCLASQCPEHSTSGSQA